MRPISSLLVAAALVGATGCATGAQEIPSWRGPTAAHQIQLVREAHAFMAEYARLLLAGDRTAIAALYDPDGALLVLNGQRIEASPAEIVQRYGAERWQPPASFQWRNLHFEAAGPEAVAVLGEFIWGETNRPPVIGTYHALLRRGERGLVIRIEDETVRQGTS